MKVFLGGTCNGPDYRTDLISKLTIDYFNPVVEDWNNEAYENELREREECDYCLYYITPHLAGVYSVAEVVDDSNKRPEKTIFYFENFSDPKMQKSLTAVSKMVLLNGGIYFNDYEMMIKFLNNQEE